MLRIGKYQGEVEVGLDLDKGLSIAEDFVMARYYMYKHVYFHKATRGVEILIGNILKRAMELNESDKLELDSNLRLILSNPTKPLSDEVLNSFINLTDHTLWHSIFQWQTKEDSILSELCAGLLQRKLYKSRVTPPHKEQMQFYKQVSAISTEENILEEYIYSLDNPSTSYYKDNYLSQNSEHDELGSEKEASEQIILFDSGGRGYELSSKSNIIKQIRNEVIQVSRLYFPDKYKGTLIGG